MSEVETLLLVESRKKSGWMAALLNLFFPGAGYMYCGRWILGIIAFLFIVTVALVTGGMGLVLVLVLVIDGFLSAGRYNKKIIEEVIKERAVLESQKNSA